MPRFSINLTDEYGQPYAVGVRRHLGGLGPAGFLAAALDESRQPRSGQLEEIIATLRDQITEAEAEELHIPGG